MLFRSHAVGIHTYNQLFNKSFEDPASAKKAMKQAIVNAVWGAPTLVPSVVRPVAEVAMNHDMFTGREVVPRNMENVDIEEQYKAGTSNLAKTLGRMGVMSPLNADHLIKGWLGVIGASVFTTADAAIGAGLGMPYASMTGQDIIKAVPGAASLVAKDVDTGSMNKFYDLYNEVRKAQATANIKVTNAPQDVESYAKEKGILLDQGLKTELNSRMTALKEIGKYERYIASTPNKDMSPAQKREELNKLKEQRELVLKDIQQIRNAVYR